MRRDLDLLRLGLETGKPKGDRTGTGTLSVFGAQARFDLRETFPLLTTKKIHLKSIIHELLWFLRRETTVRSLQQHGRTICNEWPADRAALGRGQLPQWHDWRGPPGCPERGGFDDPAIAPSRLVLLKPPDFRLNSCSACTACR